MLEIWSIVSGVSADCILPAFPFAYLLYLSIVMLSFFLFDDWDLFLFIICVDLLSKTPL